MLKYLSSLLIITLCGIPCFAQRDVSHLKGKLFFYWGWNTDQFSKSDLHFKGPDHDFTLNQVIAEDRPTHFSIDAYFNPGNLSTPQYNYRMGYYLNDHFSISLGMDHMKYVMVQDQVVSINGYIKLGSVYDGNYKNQAIQLKPDFLKFEHTNGLNYANIEFRRLDDLIQINHLKIKLNSGIGAGVLIPRTDATLLNKAEYDEFHLAGYGIAPSLGINFTFFNSFFIQTEYKAGYLNLPDIRTTINLADKASQHFWFGQLNLVFGTTIGTRKKDR
ncbi:MAG: hypothetical protein ABI761_14520 [Saprospiraceae bacterium]